MLKDFSYYSFSTDVYLKYIWIYFRLSFLYFKRSHYSRAYMLIQGILIKGS